MAAGVGLGSALLSALTGQIGRIAKIAARLVGAALLTKKVIHDHDTNFVLMRYFKKNSRHFGAGSDYIDARTVWVKTEENYRKVFFRNLNLAFSLLLFRGRPIFYVPNLDDNGALKQYPVGTYYSIHGTVNWEAIIKAASDLDLEHQESVKHTIRKFQVIRHVGTRGQKTDDRGESPPPMRSLSSGGENDAERAIGYHPAELGREWNEDPLGDLSLTPEAERLVRDVKFWYRNREWYVERRIAWRRGYGLRGKPGNGKTSLVRALAQHLDLPVHIFDLASMSNQDFIKSWENSQRWGVRIVLLEDFDNVFHGRTNVSGSDLTFDTILNAIDGIERQDGLLLFVTTNHIEHLDPAMGVPDENGRSTRPGRIDVVVELPPLDRPGRLKLAMRITRDPTASERLADEGHEDTAVQFQDRAERYAREQLWAGLN